MKNLIRKCFNKRKIYDITSRLYIIYKNIIPETANKEMYAY